MEGLRNVLVGVKSGSHGSQPLEFGLELATRAHARLTALIVTDPTFPTPGAAPALPGRVSTSTAVGIPAIEIARRADATHADLVILGRDLPLAAASREGRGTVEGTVRRAHVPCLLVPAHQKTFHHVLAAVDGGPDSSRVIAAALLVGRLFHATVRALHVEEPVGVGVGAHGGAPVTDDHGCETIVGLGDPVSEILRVTREAGVDLVVVGHHRGGPISPHATSGVGPRVLQRAPCAVLTVPI